MSETRPIVQDEQADPEVVPKAVDEQQPLQEGELGDRVVGAAHRLHPLVARHADADVRLLDHRHVVAAVANRQAERRRLRVVLDEAHDVGLFAGNV